MNTSLSDEQLNIAICEWKGWTKCEQIGAFSLGLRPGWIHEENREKLPSHVLSIEALGNMHAAILSLGESQRNDFMNYLCVQRGLAFLVGLGDIFALCFEASLQDLAIALLQVVKPEVFE